MSENCEYVKDYYGVPAEVGRRVAYKGELGTIYKDGGQYVAVNFDSEKPGFTVNVHPTDPDLIYLEKVITPRAMSRGQRRYREFLAADYLSCTFAEFLGIQKEGGVA